MAQLIIARNSSFFFFYSPPFLKADFSGYQYHLDWGWHGTYFARPLLRFCVVPVNDPTHLSCLLIWWWLWPHSAWRFKARAMSIIVKMVIKHSHYCFPFSLYYYSNILVLSYVFGTLTTPAYFHWIQQFWYQNVQLVQEIYAISFGISHFYTF